MSKARKVESYKSNPYISKPISRSLLTPCRQVGLSRKRKSSNNLNQSLPQIETRDNHIVGETTANRTTPVEFEDNHQNEENSIEKITIEVYNDSEIEEYGNYSNELVEKNKTETDDNSEIKTTETRRSGRKSKKASKAVQKSKKSRPDRSKTSTPILFDEDEDFVEEDKSRLEQNTTIEDNTISTKLQERNSNINENRKYNKKEKRRSKADEKQNKSSLSDTDFVEDEAIKKIQVKCKSDDSQSIHNVDCLEPTVKLIRIDSDRSPRVYINKKLEKPPKDLDENEPLSTNKKRKVPSPDLPTLEPISPVKKQKKINRSLSLKKTNSDQQKSFDLDDDFVDENSPPPPLSLQINSDDIVELEREVERKRAIIDDLKQTEIYRQLHDIVELKQLTEIWKNGCITALNDLLPYLKPHDVDMGTLLERLKVPEHLIQLSSTGDLV